MNVRAKLVGTIVLGAALLVPVAQAQSPDDQAGLRGPGGIAALQAEASNHPDNRSAARGPGAVVTQQPQTAAARPDDRGGMRGPGAYRSADLSAASHPDNRAEPRGAGAFTTAVLVESTSSGFDWRDALIGGLGGMGTALLLAGCLFLLMSQRNKTRMA
ncbi:MAG: hypothetical protein ACR2GT_07595 [Gaiellaceae bacterium]